MIFKFYFVIQRYPARNNHANCNVHRLPRHICHQQRYYSSGPGDPWLNFAIQLPYPQACMMKASAQKRGLIFPLFGSFSVVFFLFILLVILGQLWFLYSTHAHWNIHTSEIIILIPMCTSYIGVFTMHGGITPPGKGIPGQTFRKNVKLPLLFNCPIDMPVWWREVPKKEGTFLYFCILYFCSFN